MYRSHVLVCGGTGCTSSGSQKIMETLEEEIEKTGPGRMRSAVVKTGCHGLCALGPIMIVYPEGCLLFHGKGGGYSGDRVRAPVKGPCGNPSSL